MKLLNGYISIKVDEEMTKTVSGFYLQEGAVKLPSTGVVVAMADDDEEVKVGDKVEFLRYASIDGIDKDTRLCTKDMIIAVWH